MYWKNKLYRKVQNYIKRDVKGDYALMFLEWWRRYNIEIINEFEFMLDEENDRSRKEELLSLSTAIRLDANIDLDDVNVNRIMFIIMMFIQELDQEVDYTNPTRQDLERMEEDS